MKGIYTMNARTINTRKLHITDEKSSYTNKGKFIDYRLSLCGQLVIADTDFHQDGEDDKVCAKCKKLSEGE